MFSGVGKTVDELALAVDEDVLCVNVESEAELELLARHRRRQGPHRGYSVRVNPTSMRKPTPRSQPAWRKNKFGIPINRAREVYARAAKLKGVRNRWCRHAYRQPDHRARSVRRRVLRCSPISCARCAPTHTISHIDLGGGLAFPIARTTIRRPIRMPMPGSSRTPRRGLGCRLIFEPGRLIVGNAGIS